MTNSPEYQSWTFNLSLRPATALLTIAIVISLAAVVPEVAQAQTFTVLHTFTGGADGSEPSAGGLTSDKAGNLYGTAGFGGQYTSSCNWGGSETGCGTVYKMTRKGSGWIFSVLYSFNGETDGYVPDQIVSFGRDGSLYGSTYWGPGTACGGNGCGTVFKLQPPATACRAALCPWTETVLHFFQGAPSDGSQPAFGQPVFDSAGNLYSTTAWGGPANVAGNVYELTPTPNGWTEYVLHNFTGGYDGDASWSSVVFDKAGNLYGTTTYGGAFSDGAIFQLTPSAMGWTENVLHNFQNSTDGGRASGGLVLDSSGNLYGTTEYFGPNGGGTVWELSSANGGWSYTSLYDFTGGSDGGWADSTLTIDADGNLYGTTLQGGYNNNGVVWEITP